MLIYWRSFANAILVFTITAEILARSLTNFYQCQYADRTHEFIIQRRVKERERAILLGYLLFTTEKVMGRIADLTN